MIRLWIKTIRYRIEGPAFQAPGLIAFWHGDQLPLFYLLPPQAVALVSLSKDGQLQSQILSHFGVDSISGSSSKGGVQAILNLKKALKNGKLALLAVDGPRGPRHRSKSGIAYLSQKLNMPIWPVAMAVSRGFRLKHAWDGYLLPRPFCRCAVKIGTPFCVEPDCPLDEACSRLDLTLNQLTLDCESWLEAHQR